MTISACFSASSPNDVLNGDRYGRRTTRSSTSSMRIPRFYHHGSEGFRYTSEHETLQPDRNDEGRRVSGTPPSTKPSDYQVSMWGRFLP